jgi:hypothetical protein
MSEHTNMPGSSSVPLSHPGKACHWLDEIAEEEGFLFCKSEQKKTLMAKNFTKGFVFDRNLKAQSVAFGKTWDPPPSPFSSSLENVLANYNESRLFTNVVVLKADLA